jgi:quinol monooxygenase YgiN
MKIMTYLLASVMCLTVFGCDDSSSSVAADMAGVGGAGAEGGAGGVGGAGGSGAGGDAEFLFVVTGTMVAADEAQAMAAHDAVAGGGEEAARAAGDFGHDAMLATEHFGNVLGGIDFLGLDRWDDLEAANGFYMNPQVAAGFASLFDGPLSVTPYTRPDWYEWGDLDSADGGAHWFVVVRGRLADAPARMQDAHDQIAAGGEGAATALGDVAHAVFLGAADERDFLAIDVWSDDSQLEAFYGNPDFQEAFGQLFEAPASVVVYHSTDWQQW